MELEGAWECKGYKDIASEYHCSQDHVRKSASELWQLLSDLLGEDVKKKNVRSLVENRVFSYFNNGVQIGNNINVCSDLYNNPKTKKERSHSSSKESQPRHDLSEAPEYDNCLCDRTDELTTINQTMDTHRK